MMVITSIIVMLVVVIRLVIFNSMVTRLMKVMVDSVLTVVIPVRKAKPARMASLLRSVWGLWGVDASQTIKASEPSADNSPPCWSGKHTWVSPSSSCSRLNYQIMRCPSHASPWESVILCLDVFCYRLSTDAVELSSKKTPTTTGGLVPRAGLSFCNRNHPEVWCAQRWAGK